MGFVADFRLSQCLHVFECGSETVNWLLIEDSIRFIDSIEKLCVFYYIFIRPGYGNLNHGASFII